MKVLLVVLIFVTLVLCQTCCPDGTRIYTEQICSNEQQQVSLSALLGISLYKYVYTTDCHKSLIVDGSGLAALIALALALITIPLTILAIGFCIYYRKCRCLYMSLEDESPIIIPRTSAESHSPPRLLAYLRAKRKDLAEAWTPFFCICCASEKIQAFTVKFDEE